MLDSFPVLDSLVTSHSDDVFGFQDVGFPDNISLQGSPTVRFESILLKQIPIAEFPGNISLQRSPFVRFKHIMLKQFPIDAIAGFPDDISL